MDQFKLEYYRQPWETGPHWKLKREFLEKYCHMLPEDRLLYLAQAYANITLMNYSYPDPVMREISRLGEPLQMPERFQKCSDNSKVIQNQDAEKGNLLCPKSERSFQQIKLSSKKEKSQESKISPANISQDSASLQSSAKSIPVNIKSKPELTSHQEDNKCDNDAGRSGILSNESSSDIHKYSKIVYSVGIGFIENFVQQLKKFQAKHMSPLDSIMSAGQTLKIMQWVKFKQFVGSNCPPHARIFCCRFILKNRSIVCETSDNMKIAKDKCAKSAVDILIKISNLYSCIGQDNSIVDSSQGNCSKVTDSNKTLEEDMIMIRRLGKAIPQGSRKVSLSSLFHAMKSLNIEQYILFKKSGGSKAGGFNWKLFYKNILLSSVSSGKRFKTGKKEALSAALDKLWNLSNYEIRNGELIEKVK